MTITINVVSSNSAHDEVYSIQHYVIKFIKLLATGRWFSPGTPVSSTNKTHRHDKTNILLKVASNTINLNHPILLGLKCAELSGNQRTSFQVAMYVPYWVTLTLIFDSVQSITSSWYPEAFDNIHLVWCLER